MWHWYGILNMQGFLGMRKPMSSQGQGREVNSRSQKWTSEGLSLVTMKAKLEESLWREVDCSCVCVEKSNCNKLLITWPHPDKSRCKRLLSWSSSMRAIIRTCTDYCSVLNRARYRFFGALGPAKLAKLARAESEDIVRYCREVW